MQTEPVQTDKALAALIAGVRAGRLPTHCCYPLQQQAGTAFSRDWLTSREDIRWTSTYQTVGKAEEEMILRSLEPPGCKLCRTEVFGQGCGGYLPAVAYTVEYDVYCRNHV